jgi:hypothetical protein
LQGCGFIEVLINNLSVTNEKKIIIQTRFKKRRANSLAQRAEDLA